MAFKSTIGTYVNGPFGDFGEIQTRIAMTIDVAIEIRLQLG